MGGRGGGLMKGGCPKYSVRMKDGGLVGHFDLP